MTDLTLPTPAQLRAERDPSKRLLALVEPATNMLVRATRVDDANEIRSQAAAIERYARSIRLSTEAWGAAQTIARRAEVRIGELSPKRPVGRGKLSSADDNLTPDQRHDFRTLADHAPTVEQVLGDLAPDGKATRSAVLHAIKREGMEQWVREGEARTEDGAAEMLELQRALRRALEVLQRIKGNGRAFDAAPLARRVMDLCREVEEVLTK